MKLSAWIGLIAISGCLGLVACSDDSEDGTGTDGGAGTGGSGGSAGASTGGTAGASTGGTAGAGTGGSAGAAGCDKSGEPCGDCIADNCCTEVQACWAETECNNIYECIANNCQDADAGATCQSDCIAQFPNGTATFGPFAACVQTSCAAECT